MFVKLTLRYTDEDVWVNSEQVMWFGKCKEKGKEYTELVMSRGNSVWVEEAPEKVEELLTGYASHGYVIQTK